MTACVIRYAIDEQVPFQLNILLAQSFLLLGALAVISYSLPFFLVLMVPLGLVYHRLQDRYRATSRQVHTAD